MAAPLGTALLFIAVHRPLVAECRRTTLKAFDGNAGVNVYPLSGSCEVRELAKLRATDGAASDFFGISVSVSGGVALVGANGDDDSGTVSGSAYMFRSDGTTWVQEQKLLADDGAFDDLFGRSVSVDGDVAVVGAYGDGDREGFSGSAYVYRYDSTTWVQEQKLMADDGAAFDSFGISVSVSGGVAVVGAYGDDDNGSVSGSAYVFRYDGTAWVQDQPKLLANDGATLDLFGTSVSVSGDVALIGAPSHDGNATDSGAAYVFRYNGTTWVQEQKLLALDAAASDGFGRSVSASGDAAVIGSNGDDDNGTNSGSAYIFRHNGSTWAQEQKLLADDGAALDEFGNSVSVSDDVAVVGAYRTDHNGTNSGSAYVFRYDGTTWAHVHEVLASDAAASDAFATSVSVAGDVAVVSARLDDDKDNGPDSGSAYVYGGLAGLGCNRCPWDLDGDGAVGIVDFLDLLAEWGTDPGGPPDFDGDGNVGITDFLDLLGNWGECP